MTVQLRPLSEDDAALVVAWRSQLDVHSQLFAAEPPTLEAHRAWFGRYAEARDREEYVIIDGDRPVGTIGLSHIDRANRRAEYGVLIGDPLARGRGVARAASVLVLDRAFGPLALNRVFLHVFSDNPAAIALYARLGFKREGVLRQHVVKDGAARDVVAMGILAGEMKR